VVASGINTVMACSKRGARTLTGKTLSTVRTGAKPGYTSPSTLSGFFEKGRTQSEAPGHSQSLPLICEALDDSYLSLFVAPTSKESQQAQQSSPRHALYNRSPKGGPRGTNGLVAQFERGPATSSQSGLPETFRSMIPPGTGQSLANVSILSFDQSKSCEAVKWSIIPSEMIPGRDNRGATPPGGKNFLIGPASSPQLVPPSIPSTSCVHHSARPYFGTLWEFPAPKSLGVQNLESELRCPSGLTQLQYESSNSRSNVYNVHASFNEVCACH
jgi:hypothetical protein